MSNLSLTATKIIEVAVLFEKLNWEMDASKPLESSTFNRFCHMMSYLDIEQQNLIIDLAKRFLIIKESEYVTIFKNALELVPDTLLKEKIFIAPLVAPEDFKKNKSSSFLVYMCQTFGIKNNPKFVGKKVIFSMTAKEFIKRAKKIHTPNSTIFLVDDFVGTGDTAINAIDYIVENSLLSYEHFTILALAAHQSGINKIKDKKIKIYNYHTINRGISDFYNSEDTVKHIDIMQKIENEIKVLDRFKLGYGNSEALISLLKTPNNTFPIFWHEPKTKKRLAPFPRY